MQLCCREINGFIPFTKILFHVITSNKFPLRPTCLHCVVALGQVHYELLICLIYQGGIPPPLLHLYIHCYCSQNCLVFLIFKHQFKKSEVCVNNKQNCIIITFNALWFWIPILWTTKPYIYYSLPFSIISSFQCM